MNLAQAQHAVKRARDAYAAATAARDEVVRAERAKGATTYALAKQLGVSPNAVRRMLGIASDQKK